MTAQVRSGPDPLLNLLENLHPGDEIEAAVASEMTSLDVSTCENVFEALVRVGLFVRTIDGTFVRQRMFEVLEGHGSLATRTGQEMT